MQLLLNELSLLPSNNRHLAREAMSVLLQTVGAVQALGAAEHVLLVPQDLIERSLAAEYRLSDWLYSDPAVDPDERTRLGGLISWGPYLEEEHGLEEQEATGLSVYHREGGPTGHGLGLAYRRDQPVISLRSEERWHADPLPVYVLGSPAEFVGREG